MVARVSIYNRLAIVLLPALSFVASCIFLLTSVGGSILEITDMVFFFGVRKGFLVIPAIIGLVIGTLDWRFPSKRRLLISSAILSTITALFHGWALSESIIYF